MEVTAADAMRVAFVSGDALGVSAEALLGEEEPPRSTNDRTPTRSASPPRRGASFSAATPPARSCPTFA